MTVLPGTTLCVKWRGFRACPRRSLLYGIAFRHVTRQIGNAVPCDLSFGGRSAVSGFVRSQSSTGYGRRSNRRHGHISQMTDTLSRAQRSNLMSKVRSKGNRSTELKTKRVLEEFGIEGWVQHPSDVPGRPDFYFPQERLAVFVDGCFWHACPKCGRIPKTRVAFWREKIEGNRRRDLALTRRLRRHGYHVMRLWEHSLRDDRWVSRLIRTLRKCGGNDLSQTLRCIS